jgi:hypothetical protein
VFLVSSTLADGAGPPSEADHGLGATLVGDGTPLVILTGLALMLAGSIALLLAASGQFLPHDSAYLGMSADELCAVDDCRIVRFMVHDRAAFGGTLIAIGVLYAWLGRFPLRRGEAWAWWTLTVSGILGFGSFLDYLGYGYLDTWHAIATLALLPTFAIGLLVSRRLLVGVRDPLVLLRPARPGGWAGRGGIGRGLLVLTGFGMVGAGLTILIIGATAVFVPQDLEFLRLTPADLSAIDPHLVPLIAHDRAGFGGGLATTGVAVLCCAWCATPSRSLWQALLAAGSIGFGAAVGIHLLVGYLDLTHVGPAIAGAAVFAVGIALFPRRSPLGDPTAGAAIGQSSSPWAEAVGSPSRGRGSSPGP